DDARLGRVHGGDAVERGLEVARRIAADHFEALDAVLESLAVDPLDLGDLLFAGRDDQLAALAVRDAVGFAIGVQHAPAARAVVRAPGASRVVHAAVDPLAVARGHAVADARGPFRDHHLVAGAGGRPRHREPDDTGADHQDLHRTTIPSEHFPEK